MPLDDKDTTKEARWVGDVWLDVIVEESFSHSAQVTEHAVEQGADISDHVHLLPEELTIVGVVSNTPLEQPQSHAGGAAIDTSPEALYGEPKTNAVLGLAQMGIGAAGLLQASPPPREQADALSYREFRVNSLRFTTEFDRVSAVDQALQNLIMAGEPVPVYTTRRAYEAVVLTRYEPESASRGVLRFSLSGRVVQVVASESVDLPEPVQPRGKGKKNKGKKQAAKAKESQVSKSFLFNVFRG